MHSSLPDFPLVKLEIFIPVEHVEALRQVLGQVGAGRIGDYDHCCSVVEVRGYWRPLSGAQPYQGEIGRVEEARECKVEVNCELAHLQEVVRAIYSVHPYEEPLINVVPLLNHLVEGKPLTQGDR